MGSIDVLQPLIPNDWHIDNSEAVMSTDPCKIYAEWDHLRENCPVAHVDRLNGYWILTKHEDIKAAAQDSNTWISGVCAVVPSDPRGIRRAPLRFDGKDHAPYRTALDRTLKASRLARIEPIMEKHAEDELRKLLEKGSGDICLDFGSSLAAFAEKEWLNLDLEDTTILAANVRHFVTSYRDGDWASVKMASEQFYKVARKVIEDRKTKLRCPEEDPASSLLVERDHNGEPLEEEHLIGCVRQSLVVAMVAPPILMGAICKHLSEDKDLQAKLRDDPSLIPAALEEFVRLYTPYRGFSRTATRDISIRDQVIPQDEPVTLTYAAANRDPEVFPDPGVFKMDRENITQHLGFGKGKHRCAGMPLARLMMKAFIRVLLRMTKDFEIDGVLEYAKLPEVGIISCPVRFTL